MTTVTIPKQLTRKGELVIIPRKEYEDFLRLQIKKFKEIGMTLTQKKMLEQARKNLTHGKFFTIHELKRKLGTKD